MKENAAVRRMALVLQRLSEGVSGVKPVASRVFPKDFRFRSRLY